MRRFFALLLIFSVIVAFYAHAQRDAIAFDRITVEDGLSQSTVYAILQDHKGFMWFGTDDGLNRYDGYSFEVFNNNSDDKSTLSNGRVISLLEDSKNRLWIGTIDGGLNLFDWETETFKSYRHDHDNPQSISIDRAMALCEDTSGKIWVGTADGGLNLFDPEKEVFKIYKNTPENPNLLPSNVIRSLFIDSNNQLFIGTTEGVALYNRDNDTFVPFSILLDDGTEYNVKVVRRFLEDDERNIWIATDENGLIRYNPTNKTFKVFQADPSNQEKLASNTILDFHMDEEGYLWIATFAGLHKYNPTNNTFQRYRHNKLDLQSISSDLLRVVYEDNMGVLWLGTYNHGINKFDRKYRKFTIYRNHPEDPLSLPSSTIRAFLEDINGNIWIGTYGEGIVKLDVKTEQFTHYKHNPNNPNSLANNYITSITKDTKNNLWIGTNNGLSMFNPLNNSFTNFYHLPNNPKSLPNNRIRNVYVDKQDVLWVGTLADGLCKMLPDGKSFKTYRADPINPEGSLSQDRIIALFEDSRGNFWVGTSNYGLNLLDRETDEFTKLYTHDRDDKTTISSNRIMCLFEDSMQRLWIGTGGGGLNLFDYETKSFISFNTSDGLPNDVIYGMLEDDNGIFWLSTNYGISRFDYTNPSEPLFRNYDKHDGLQNNEFSEGAYLKTSEGLMFFGGIFSFNVFNPLDITDNEIPPMVYVTDLRISDKHAKTHQEKVVNLLEKESYNLNYYQNNITIRFTALHYSVPQKISYKYMLEGFENSWVEPIGDLRFATYTNLKPGKYTFRVIASNPDGVWNYVGDKIHLEIKPPFWNMWWFYVLLGIGALGLVFGLIQVREAALVRSKRELEKMVAQRTKEISTQNQEILKQAERLKLANEEITSTSEALSEQNKLLQAKNDEIMLQHNELEEQRNSLANLAWELQDKNEEITAQRNEIEKQKDLLAQQKKEITDSIFYAQRIQQAVLPTQEQIKELFPEFFILNRPKSIVSGDFYWATRIGKYRILAVVDCTGHGVPGGFMSMLGVLMLNEVVSLRRILDPAQALNHLRQSIISVLHQKGDITDAADGMDISICVINDDDLTLTYAGANSSMLIYDPSKDFEDALIELRSDRMPIAYYLIMKSFRNQTIKMSPGTSIFLYSDGLVDQFGGPKNKKFQHNKFRQFVVQNKDLPIESQGIVLEQTFEKWKGKSFQVDDVLVIGLKV